MDNIIRAIDANHLLTRLKSPKTKEDFIYHETIKMFVDTEPTIEVPNPEPEEMQWLVAKRERKAKDVHAVSYGVECNICHCFLPFKRRYCPDCGRKFNGELDIKDFKSALGRRR